MAIHLKTERLRRGWSQAELARQAQMNANTISLIESDRFRPYDSQLRKLAHALGVPEGDAPHLVRDDPVGGGHDDGQ